MSDYISREAITEYLMGRIKNYLEMDDRLAIIPLNFAMAHIKSLPAADVEPVKHGRWEHLGGDEWCCSVCGFVITTEGSWDNPTQKYCEECGAKMDGGVENAAD